MGVLLFFIDICPGEVCLGLSGDSQQKRHDGGGSPRRSLVRLRRRLPWISAPEGWVFQDLMLVFVYR